MGKQHGEILAPVDLLLRFAQTAFGVPEQDAKICADVLLRSDLRGISSHGAGRLPVA